MERFVRRIMKFFSTGGWGELGNLGTSINISKTCQKHKISSQKHNKKRPRWEIFLKFFSRYSLKVHFEWKILPKDRNNQAFFPKNQVTFIRFSKKAGEASPLSLVAHLWVRLNMHQYPWISLNILENAWINCFEHARALVMLDHLTCLTDFGRCLGF